MPEQDGKGALDQPIESTPRSKSTSAMGYLVYGGGHGRERREQEKSASLAARGLNFPASN